MKSPLTLASLSLALIAGCAANPESRVDLGAIYNRSAQTIGTDRNPVVVIPGILGTKLVQEDSRRIVWGAFTYGAADADNPEGARLVALPMREGAPLADRRDDVEPDGVLTTLEANVAVLKITALRPYQSIIRTLAAGRYTDRDITRAAAGTHANDRPASGFDDAGTHFTCFQFDYDWRRDISEQAPRLHQLIAEASALATAARDQTRGAASADPVKVDIVAHSMGGMVLMYYLKYGTAPLPEDGSLPPLTWAGAKLIRNAVIVGTPSAGSVLSFKQLIEGAEFAPIAPTYRPAVLGTMPAIYQLMPRQRHHPVIDAATGQPIDIYDPDQWERRHWGLADPGQAEFIKWLLPETKEAEVRRRIALDQLTRCLRRAEQLHRALDIPAETPPGLELHLFAGDAKKTPAKVAVDPKTNRIKVATFAPGDGTVTRASALMDERQDGEWSPRLRSPIPFDTVRFLPQDHIGLTADPVFTDNLLYLLLERADPTP